MATMYCLNCMIFNYFILFKYKNTEDHGIVECEKTVILKKDCNIKILVNEKNPFILRGQVHTLT